MLFLSRSHEPPYPTIILFLTFAVGAGVGVVLGVGDVVVAIIVVAGDGVNICTKDHS